MVRFNLFLTFDDEDSPRVIAEGCSNEQAIEILQRHLMLACVAHFSIVPIEYYVPFKEYTL